MTANKWFFSFLKKYRWMMGAALCLTTLIAALAIVNPYISGLIVDDVIIGGKHALLPKLIAALLMVTGIRGILRFFYQVIFETCSQGVLYEMRDKVYRKLLQEKIKRMLIWPMVRSDVQSDWRYGCHPAFRSICYL